MLASIVEEVGELAREINDLEGYKKKKVTEKKRNLELELADIVFSIICIANYYKIDLEKALSKVIEKYTKRDIGRWTACMQVECENGSACQNLRDKRGS